MFSLISTGLDTIKSLKNHAKHDRCEHYHVRAIFVDSASSLDDTILMDSYETQGPASDWVIQNYAESNMRLAGYAVYGQHEHGVIFVCGDELHFAVADFIAKMLNKRYANNSNKLNLDR